MRPPAHGDIAALKRRPAAADHIECRSAHDARARGRMGMVEKIAFAALAGAALCGPFACGGDDAPPPGEQTGQSCTSAAQCFPDIPDGGLKGGGPVCIDRVTGGYCTHTCTTDADCCAVPGECKTGYPQVCSPFESTNKIMYCFLSCEELPNDAGVTSGDAFCTTYAHKAFGCRSSGGGPENRKVCVP